MSLEFSYQSKEETWLNNAPASRLLLGKKCDLKYQKIFGPQDDSYKLKRKIRSHNTDTSRPFAKVHDSEGSGVCSQTANNLLLQVNRSSFQEAQGEMASGTPSWSHLFFLF